MALILAKKLSIISK